MHLDFLSPNPILKPEDMKAAGQEQRQGWPGCLNIGPNLNIFLELFLSAGHEDLGHSDSAGKQQGQDFNLCCSTPKVR